MTEIREEIFAQSFPFWNRLSKEEKSELCRQTTFVECDKGENIHGNTGNCTGAILVKSGILRTYMLSDEGKEITLYRLYPGDICMLSASCVIQSITFDVYVDAEMKSEIFIIGSGALARLTEQNLYVENYCLKLATERFSEVMWAMQQILFMSMDRRLAVFLLDELSKTQGNVIRLTQEQIAKYMGSAREVVSRMLKYFAAEGLVAPSRGGVEILDKAGLTAIAALGG